MAGTGLVKYIFFLRVKKLKYMYSFENDLKHHVFESSIKKMYSCTNTDT